MAAAITGARTRVVVAPPPVARRGFLAAARVVPVTGHPLLGAEYTTDACGTDAGSWSQWCVDAIASQCVVPATPPDPAKTFDHAVTNVVEGDPFTIYAGSECDLMSLDEQRQRAEATLAYAEAFQVDAFMRAALLAMDVSSTLTGAVECVIPALEASLALVYGGEGVIAAPMHLVGAAIGEGVIYRELDGSLRTHFGSLVAAYIAAPSVSDVFATGQITLLQGPVKPYSVPPMQRSDGTCEPARALAERTYVPLIECVVLSATATCCDCTGTP